MESTRPSRYTRAWRQLGATMYEDVLDDGALQAMWDEHPEAFHVDALQEEVDRLKEELDEARRQLSADPIQAALDEGDYVCPMLGRGCLWDGCKLYVYGRAGNREHEGTGCALAVMAMALHSLDAVGIELC